MKSQNNNNNLTPDFKNKKISKKLASTLELPSNTFDKMFQLEMFGNSEAIIEGCVGIAEYSETFVKLKIPKGYIKFLGRNLSMNFYTQTSVMVEGFILSIEFEV